MFRTYDVRVYVAGAGCGKTTALMQELEIALKTYRPDEIAFVSFSRKAASEARNRAKEVAEDFDEDNYPYFKTLHALTYSLNNYGAQGKKIIGTKESNHFGNVTGYKFSIHLRGEGVMHQRGTLGQTCFDYYSLERSSGIAPTPKELPEQRSYREFIQMYKMFKIHNKLVDYHDCLEDYLEVGKPLSKVKFALIDEAQDLTPQQWDVCYKLFSEAVSVRIAGDDWQSIYKYQGANPYELINLSQKYELKVLKQSYRLPQSIAMFSNGIADRIRDKIPKIVDPVKKDVGYVAFVQSIDAMVQILEGVTKQNEFETWYILTRANYQIDDVSKKLKEKLVLFNYSNGFCLPESELKKIKQYYKWSKDLQYDPELKFVKKYSIPPDKNGGWEEWHKTKLVSERWRNVIHQYEKKHGFDTLWRATYTPTNILLATVFKVKGGEADNVCILTATTRKIEAARYRDNDNELRVLYTAVTRTKSRLYFFNTNSQFSMFDRIRNLFKEIEL
jgi:superfamily I DNA/RNA helicase